MLVLGKAACLREMIPKVHSRRHRIRDYVQMHFHLQGSPLHIWRSCICHSVENIWLFVVAALCCVEQY